MYDLPAGADGQTPALTGAAPLPIAEEKQPSDLHNLLRTLWRRRKVMYAVFGVLVGLVVILTLIWPKTYTTQTKLIAGNPNATLGSGQPGANSSLPVLNALMANGGVQTSETYAELFQEYPVANQVISDLNLHVGPNKVLKAMTVRPITNTPILTLSVAWSSPQMSAKIANDLANVIVARQRELIASQASSAITFLNQALPQAQARMEKAQNALAHYQTSHAIADIGAQTQSIITQLAAIDTKIAGVQVDKQQAQASLNSVRAQMGSLAPMINGGNTVAVNPVLAQLQQQLSQIDVQLATARRQYTDQYPGVIALKNQQQQLQRQIASTPQTVVSNTNTVRNPTYDQLQQQAAQYQAQASSSDAQVAALQHERAALMPTLQRLPGQASQMADLQRQATSTQDVYTALQQRYDNAVVAKETALSDVTVTQAANPMFAAKRPDLLLNLLIAIVLGAVLAVTAAFVVEFFDIRIKDQAEAERELGLPALASIPMLKPGAQALPWVRTLSVESFLQLVTSLRYASDFPMRTFSITSAGPGEGKSTIALNMAIALAEFDPPVLVVDADMRRSSLHTKLHTRNEHGLSDVLVGTKRLDEVVQRTKYAGLDLLSAGLPAPNPLKLLQSRRLEELMEHALEKYRFVVFDGPALSATLDSAVIGRKTDGSVMVVASGITDLRMAKRALRRLESVGVKNTLGFVMNRVDPRREDYSDYYLTSEPGTSMQLPVAGE